MKALTSAVRCTGSAARATKRGRCRTARTGRPRTGLQRRPGVGHRARTRQAPDRQGRAVAEADAVGVAGKHACPSSRDSWGARRRGPVQAHAVGGAGLRLGRGDVRALPAGGRRQLQVQVAPGVGHRGIDPAAATAPCRRRNRHGCATPSATIPAGRAGPATGAGRTPELVLSPALLSFASVRPAEAPRPKRNHGPSAPSQRGATCKVRTSVGIGAGQRRQAGLGTEGRDRGLPDAGVGRQEALPLVPLRLQGGRQRVLHRVCDRRPGHRPTRTMRSSARPASWRTGA